MKKRFKNYLRRKFALQYILKNYNGTYLKCGNKKLYPNPQVVGMDVMYGFDITEDGNIIGSDTPIVLEFVNHTETFSISMLSEEKHPFVNTIESIMNKQISIGEFQGLKICNSGL